MKDRAQELLPQPIDSQVLLEARELAAEGVAAAGVVADSQVPGVADDHPCAQGQDRLPGHRVITRTASSRPSRAIPFEIVVDSPPGITGHVQPGELGECGPRAPRRRGRRA